MLSATPPAQHLSADRRSPARAELHRPPESSDVVVSGSVRKAAAWCRVMLSGTVCTSVTMMSCTRVKRERIDTVFARQMMAAARHLLRQDRAAHQQHGHQMCGRAGGEQRQQHMSVAGESRPRRTSRSAASAWCRPWSPHMRQQRPEARGWPPAGHAASAAPMPPPMISSGASTPPDVPEPSATAQMIAFTASSSSADAGGMSPCSICAMLS